MRVVASLLIVLLALPAGASAQQAQAVDASKMGVDLARIKRELAEAPAQPESTEPLRLRFTVEVVATAPKIDFMGDFKAEGPLPYGSPTHDEVLNVLTPQEFNSPVIPFSGLAMLAAQKLSQFGKKKRCEAEIDEYRRLVMQGIAVAAPRCSR
jgi:hypothetical protein